jgi:hypothetical protein
MNSEKQDVLQKINDCCKHGRTGVKDPFIALCSREMGKTLCLCCYDYFFEKNNWDTDFCLFCNDSEPKGT